MLYTDKLMEAVRNVNAPIKTTSTTTLKGGEGLDIGSLMMMLMMGNMFKKPTAGLGASDIMNPMDVLGPMNSGGGFGGALSSVPQGGATGGGGLEQLLSLLMNVGKII